MSIEARRPVRALIAAMRRRGVTLVEAILYLTITLSVLILTTRILDQESARQEQQAVATDFREVIAASRLYAMSHYYDVLLPAVISAGQSRADKNLIANIDMGLLVEDGLLPELFNTAAAGGATPAPAGGAGLSEIYNKRYSLWARGVLCSDTDVPAATATFVAPPAPGSIDVDSDGDVDLVFLEDGCVRDGAGTVTDDELELEIVLMTEDDPGSPRPPTFIDPQDGGQIALATSVETAGFATTCDQGQPGSGDDLCPVLIPDPLIARGAYNAWELDLSPFKDAEPYTDASNPTGPAIDFPGTNNLAAIIALARRSVLLPAAAPDPQSALEAFDRCGNDFPIGSAQYTQCLESVEIWQNVRFQTPDDLGSTYEFPGIIDVPSIIMADPTDYPSMRSDFPGIGRITGVTFLDMREPYASGTVTDTIDMFATISGPMRLIMAPPITDGAGGFLPGSLGSIENLHGLSCAAGGSTAMDNGRMVVDCEETWFSDVLRVSRPDGGDATVDMTGEARLSGDVTLSNTTNPPSLTVAASSDAPQFTRIGGGSITLSDASGVLEISPSIPSAAGPGYTGGGIVTTAGRLRADGLDMDSLYVAGVPDEAAENLLVRPVSVRIADTALPGNPALFAKPTCPLGVAPYINVVTAIPPSTYFSGGEIYDLVRRVDIAPPTDSGGSFEVRATVTYGRQTALPATICIKSWVQTGTGGTDIRDPEVVCDYTSFRVVEASVMNPPGMFITAIVGCQ